MKIIHPLKIIINGTVLAILLAMLISLCVGMCTLVKISGNVPALKFKKCQNQKVLQAQQKNWLQNQPSKQNW